MRFTPLEQRYLITHRRASPLLKKSSTPNVNPPMTEEHYDAVIIGAGFSGTYQLIHLRKLGLKCKLVETASDFGGAWYWNRYPGARVDSDVPSYEFSLPELWKGWTWTSKFPGWQELQTYVFAVRRGRALNGSIPLQVLCLRR